MARTRQTQRVTKRPREVVEEDTDTQADAENNKSTNNSENVDEEISQSSKKQKLIIKPSFFGESFFVDLLISKVAPFMEGYDLVQRCTVVCKAWHQAINNPELDAALWKPTLINRIGFEPLGVNTPADPEEAKTSRIWFQTYRQYHFQAVGYLLAKIKNQNKQKPRYSLQSVKKACVIGRDGIVVVPTPLDQQKKRTRKAYEEKGMEADEEVLDTEIGGEAAGFRLLDHEEPDTIKTICSENGIAFKSGNGYYLLAKEESVSASKRIIVVDTKNGKVLANDDAKNFLGLSTKKEAKVSPRIAPEGCQVYIQSTSHNRKIPSESRVLVITDQAKFDAFLKQPPKQKTAVASSSSSSSENEVAMTAEERYDSQCAVGESRLGGFPDLPKDMEWPLSQKKLCTFFAQFNVRHLKLADIADYLPITDGMIWLFIPNIPDSSYTLEDNVHKPFIFIHKTSKEINKLGGLVRRKDKLNLKASRATSGELPYLCHPTKFSFKSPAPYFDEGTPKYFCIFGDNIGGDEILEMAREGRQSREYLGLVSTFRSKDNKSVVYKQWTIGRTSEEKALNVRQLVQEKLGLITPFELSRVFLTAQSPAEDSEDAALVIDNAASPLVLVGNEASECVKNRTTYADQLYHHCKTEDIKPRSNSNIIYQVNDPSEVNIPAELDVGECYDEYLPFFQAGGSDLGPEAYDCQYWVFGIPKKPLVEQKVLARASVAYNSD